MSKGTMIERVSKMGSYMKGTLDVAASSEGRSILGMAGNHAMRGAAWGAVTGGAIESAQGGSFWDGAKQGAYNGAIGWTGYRMGMKAVGAKKLNPMAKQGGLLGSTGTMWRTTSHNQQVSNQAKAILNQRQADGIARSVMNQR